MFVVGVRVVMLLRRCLECSLSVRGVTSPIRRFHFSREVLNAYRCGLGKIGREKFIKQYHVTLMRPDGSTITARVAEPKYFFQLPVNVAMLSEDDRRLRLAARKPQMKIVEEEAMEESDFNPIEYAARWKASN